MAGLLATLFGGSDVSDQGASKRLIVGLGNPGAKYERTRHNAGFMVLDALAERLGVAIGRKTFGGRVAETTLGDRKLVLLKPQQFMNRSGHVTATAAGYYKIPPRDVMVVLDDLALPVGQIRLRAKGSAGGHNGLKDMIARLGTDAFARLRVGIDDAAQRDTVDYVLSRFDSDQQAAVEQAAARAVEALLCWAQDGIEAAMNRYNSRAVSGEESQNKQ